jgi:hypothetical protein
MATRSINKLALQGFQAQLRLGNVIVQAGVFHGNVIVQAFTTSLGQSLYVFYLMLFELWQYGVWTA